MCHNTDYNVNSEHYNTKSLKHIGMCFQSHEYTLQYNKKGKN